MLKRSEWRATGLDQAAHQECGWPSSSQKHSCVEEETQQKTRVCKEGGEQWKLGWVATVGFLWLRLGEDSLRTPREIKWPEGEERKQDSWTPWSQALGFSVVTLFVLHSGRGLSSLHMGKLRHGAAQE